MKSVGRHLVLELWGCQNLNSPEIVERALLDIVEALNLTLLSLNVHPFSPIGVTGVAIVSESHVVIHTWPELSYAAVDVFTCGELHLDHDADQETRHGEEHADANLSQRSEWKHAIHGGIDDVGEQWDERHDQQRIGGLHLGGQDLHAQYHAVHAIGLEHPCRAGLIEERPEHGDEDIESE